MIFNFKWWILLKPTNLFPGRSQACWAGEEAKWLEPHRLEFVDSYPPPPRFDFFLGPHPKGTTILFWVKFALQIFYFDFFAVGWKMGTNSFVNHFSEGLTN